VTGTYVPGAFTPNSDGRNDVLHVLGTGLTRMELAIYNRWGVVVFQSRQPGDGWDGRFRNVLQPAGVYVWVLTGTNSDGQAVRQKGTVLLLH
jgi:gliding motility-associated-like protein